MLTVIQVFFTGLIISLLGSLPLGTLNITSMQVSIQENTRKAIHFALGAALVEIIYVRVSLTGMNWVMTHEQVFYILEWVTVFLFLALAVGSFVSAGKSREQKNLLLNHGMNRFMLGFTMSAINPVQIPFWFIWSTYLMSNNILQPIAWQFNLYTVGIGIGTLLGFGVFIFAGKWLINKLNASQRIINISVGIIFVVSAFFQLYRVITKPMEEQFKGKNSNQPSAVSNQKK